MSEVLNKINEAGALCIKLTHAIRQDEGPKPSQSQISNEMISTGLERIRCLIQDIDIASLNFSENEHQEELMKFSAIQSFLKVFEERENEIYSKANLEIFGLQVDVLHGGPSATILGGRKAGKKRCLWPRVQRSARFRCTTCRGHSTTTRQCMQKIHQLHYQAQMGISAEDNCMGYVCIVLVRINLVRVCKPNEGQGR